MLLGKNGNRARTGPSEDRDKIIKVHFSPDVEDKQNNGHVVKHNYRRPRKRKSSVACITEDSHVQLLRLTGTKPFRGAGSGIYTMSASPETDSVEGGEEVEKKKRPCHEKFRGCLQAVYKVFASNFGLILLLIAYTCAGALLFQFIESSHEKEVKASIVEEREKIVDILMNLTLETESFDTNLTNWTATARERLSEYEEKIYQSYKDGVGLSSSDEIWTFWGALFFCGTVYTSIGYGNIAPSTNWGRVACIFYASIGIPLAMIVLADLGRRLTRGLKCLWAFVRRYYYTGHFRRINFPLKDSRSRSYDINTCPDEGPPAVANGTEVRPGVNMYYGYEVDDNFNLPMSVAILVIIVYLLFGAGMYTIWEEWNYLEAFYFVFISLSTIGFGDVLPAHPKYFLLSSVYIFIGLSLISMVINVAMEFFSVQIDRAKVQIDKAKEITMDQVKEKIDQAKEKVAELKNKLDSDSISSVSETDKNTISNGKGKRKGSGQDTPVGTGRKNKQLPPKLEKTEAEQTNTQLPFNQYNSTGSVSMLDDFPYIDK